MLENQVLRQIRYNPLNDGKSSITPNTCILVSQIGVMALLLVPLLTSA